VSVVLPCLDEEETVGDVVAEALQGLAAAGVRGEVVVVDNGSADRSAERAAAAGARVIHEPRRGYGQAYLTGLAAARGELIVLADADGTYPLADLTPLLQPLREGAGLVLGSRFQGTMAPHAMPFLNRWVGNPILTGTLNLFFGAGVSDAHCGLRAVRRDALPLLDLRTTGMEFASEMVLKAAKRRVPIAETPIDYRVRGGSSKLSPYRDAWRHVRLMLVHSPSFLFLLPGLLAFVLGSAALAALAAGPLDLFGRTWQIHSAIFASVLALVGAQIVQLGLFARTYAVLYLGDTDPVLERFFGRLRLEHGLLAGAVVLAAGVGVLAYVVAVWAAAGFADLEAQHLSVVGLTLVGIGVQIVFGSFFLSILGLRGNER